MHQIILPQSYDSYTNNYLQGRNLSKYKKIKQCIEKLGLIKENSLRQYLKQ